MTEQPHSGTRLNSGSENYHAVEEEHEDVPWLREQRALHKTLHWLQRPLVVMIGIAIFLWLFATSSAESTRQMLAFKLACNTVLGGSGQCDLTKTQVLVLSLQQGYAIAVGIATLVALGKVGPLSDQYGRRRFIMLIISAQIVGKVAKYYVMSRYDTLQFSTMVATEFVGNCFGGVMTMVTLTNCYVSDISEAADRTYYLGVNMAFFFIGLSTGPLAGNMLLLYGSSGNKTLLPGTRLASNISPGEFLPLKAELAIFVFLLVFVVLVVPESRSQNARRMSRLLLRSLLQLSLLNEQPGEEVVEESKAHRIFDMFNFLRPLRLLAYPKDCVAQLRWPLIKANRKAVSALILFDCLMVSLAIPMGEICVLYGIYRFGWTARNLGHMLAVGCFSRAITLVVVSPFLINTVLRKTFKLQVNKKRFDHIDYSVVATGFIAEAVGVLLLSAAPTGNLFLSTLTITSLGSLSSPAINSSVVKFFPESRIGEVFAAIALVRNMLTTVMPVLLLGLYKLSLSKWNLPQFPFYVVAFISVLLFCAATFAIRVLDLEDKRLKRAALPHRGSFRGQ